jgi:hypothetical protein
VTADDAGRYSILNVLAGSYEMKVTATGFRTLTRTDVEVAINTVTRVDAKLEVGAVTEEVTVNAAMVTLQTDKSDVRHEITGATVQNLPLPAYRNYQSLIALVPGASPPATQNAVVDTPGRALRSFVNGTATNNNNTLVDGAVNINILLPHHVAYVQPVESIDTVNISTGSFDAEQGMAGGAAVTVATKSGTNDLHGTGWWYNNNQHFNSNPVYYRPVGYTKPLAIMNIFGGNVGGPIIRTSCSTSSTSSAPRSAPDTSLRTRWPRPISARATSATGRSTRWCTTRPARRRTTRARARRSRTTSCRRTAGTPFSRTSTKTCRCRTRPP